MALDWKYFFDQHLKDVLGGASWPPSQQEILNMAHKQVAGWLAGDNAAIKKAITDALQDNSLTEKELAGILTLAAQNWLKDKFFGNDFVQRLIDALSDGKLSASEIADVAAELIAKRTDIGDPLKQLLKSAVDGHLSRDEIETALLVWVKQKAPGLEVKLQQLLDSSDPVNLRSVIMLAVSFLIVEEKITNPVSTIDKQIKGVVDALKNYANGDLVDLIQALVDKNYVTAAKVVLKKLGVATIEDAVIKQILDGKYAEVAQDFLAKALKREITGINEEQAAGLADAIIKIVSGKLELIPAKSEQESLQLNNWQYDIWIRIRKVLYAAKMALNRGAIVPSDPMAQPHVFAAASIRFDTPVNSLAPKADWQRLLDILKTFTYREFMNSPGGEQYKLESPIYMDMLIAGRTAEYIFDDVCGKLSAGLRR